MENDDDGVEGMPFVVVGGAAVGAWWRGVAWWTWR